MNQTDEFLIMAFYAHRLHIDDACRELLHPSESMMHLCDEVISVLLNTDCCDIIKVIHKSGFRFDINKSDIPQFSSFADCAYKVPLIVQDCGIEDLTYLRMGFMLRVKPRKDGADFKYGENQTKTAAQMGLCAIVNAKIFPSYMGIAYNKLGRELQEKIVPKLILFIPYIYNQFSTKATFHDINNSLSILAESTKNRRLTNIWSLINQVNKVLPYEFQINRY